MSENPLTQPSSWVVYLLDFPITSADRQALDQSSPFVHDRVKGESPMHVHHCMTLSRGSWCSRGERAAKKPRHCLIRQPVRRFRQRLILRLSLYRDCSARHAYPAAESPSKPLRTRSRKHLFQMLYYYTREGALCQAPSRLFPCNTGSNAGIIRYHQARCS